MNGNTSLSMTFCKHSTDNDVFIFFNFQLFYIKKYNRASGSGAFSHWRISHIKLVLINLDENIKKIKNITSVAFLLKRTSLTGVFAQRHRQ
jgi:hypothetical protein